MQDSNDRLESRPTEPEEGDTQPLKIRRPAAPPPFVGSGALPADKQARARPQETGAGTTNSSDRYRTTVPSAGGSRTEQPPTQPDRNPIGSPGGRTRIQPGQPNRRVGTPPAQTQTPNQRPIQLPANPLRPRTARPLNTSARPPVWSGRIDSRGRAVYSARPPERKISQIGCLVRGFFAGVFAILVLGICSVSIAAFQYFRIARTLPGIDNLSSRASQFETTRILDREGNILYELVDPNAGRRTYVPLEKISPYLVAATVATEDHGYYSHPGFDATAIVRAFIQNTQAGGTVSGASTITQQLARTLLFTPEERGEQTYSRKVREAILASEITRRYSKNEILEIYLNEIYYGNLAYGIEAASETYFKTTSDKLTLAQASFLAGLPQSPAVYDVYTNPEAALARHRDVLALMYRASIEDSCIFVSNSPTRVCVDAVAATRAAEEIRGYSFPPPVVQIRYPHWVMYVRSLLEAQYDPQTIYRLGYSVYTTLDPALQSFAQQAVAEQVQSMAVNNAKNGALVALKPSTGEILAMVGSPDFYNEVNSGQVNMAISPRQPGSAIKPLTYAAAFEKGWTPATLIWDVPSEFPPSGRADDTGPTYKPQNYDGRFHGPVTARSALANSYNIPAVKTLQFVGIYDDPNQPGEDGLIAFARRLGIDTLDKPDYGLSLTLGGGDVTLLDLTSAYATFANSGMMMPPTAISRIVDRDGKTVYEYRPDGGQSVVRPDHAYLITSILADNQARVPAFGANSVLQLTFPAAVKTGTTNDFRDNWTIGYNPDLAVGVWIGNADYSVMQNTTGISGAAPVWNRVMSEWAPRMTNGSPSQFSRPATVVEMVVCEISGTIPSQWCPRQRTELFTTDQPPLPADQDLWQKVLIDTWTGLRASQACPDFIEEKSVMNVTDPWARRWVRQDPQGVAWASAVGFDRPIRFTPQRECRADDPRPTLIIAYPQDGETIRDTSLNIYGLIDSPEDFDVWILEAGLGEKPVEWDRLAQGANRVRQPDILANLDLRALPPGQVVTLRLRMQGPNGATAERRIRMMALVPTPTPTPTPEPTATPEPTWTPQPTATATFPPPPSATPTEIEATPVSLPLRFPKATQSP